MRTNPRMLIETLIFRDGQPLETMTLRRGPASFSRCRAKLEAPEGGAR